MAQLHEGQSVPHAGLACLSSLSSSSHRQSPRPTHRIARKSRIWLPRDFAGPWRARAADGSEETLAASEYDLLRVFAENPNRPLNRDWLLEVTSHREMEAFDRSICGLHGCAARSRSIRVGLRPSALCGASATCSCRRGIETKFDVVSDASIQRASSISASARRNSLAKGPRPSRQVLWSPALPARSSSAAAVATPVAPTAWAAPLSL